jgi:predicted RNase H-like HicB family nuclease
MRYIVLIRRTATGYSADVPDLPGCVARGLTVEHTRQQIAEAIQGHLDVMRESGEDVPPAKPHLEFAVDEEMGEEYCTWVESPEAADTPHGGPGVATKQRQKRRRT